MVGSRLQTTLVCSLLSLAGLLATGCSGCSEREPVEEFASREQASQLGFSATIVLELEELGGTNSFSDDIERMIHQVARYAGGPSKVWLPRDILIVPNLADPHAISEAQYIQSVLTSSVNIVATDGSGCSVEGKYPQHTVSVASSSSLEAGGGLTDAMWANYDVVWFVSPRESIGPWTSGGVQHKQTLESLQRVLVDRKGVVMSGLDITQTTTSEVPLLEQLTGLSHDHDGDVLCSNDPKFEYPLGDYDIELDDLRYCNATIDKYGDDIDRAMPTGQVKPNITSGGGQVFGPGNVYAVDRYGKCADQQPVVWGVPHSLLQRGSFCKPGQTLRCGPDGQVQICDEDIYGTKFVDYLTCPEGVQSRKEGSVVKGA